MALGTNRKNFTKKQVEKAIEGSFGILQNVGDKLNCHRSTAKRYIIKHKLEKVLEDEVESALDYAENKLIENIEDNESQSIHFFLTKKGKHRGYGEKIEHSGEIHVKTTIDYGT